MDTSELTTLITSVGFPIVAYFWMFKSYNEVLQGVQKSINDNTLIIQKLIDEMQKAKKEED